MKVKSVKDASFAFLKNHLANFITFIGFFASCLLFVLLWEVVSIYSSTGTAAWSTKTSWAIFGLATLAVATDWADGRIARSKWGRISKLGEWSDKLRDKIIIAIVFVNLIRCLYAIPYVNFFLYALVRLNMALLVSALMFDMALLIFGTVALVYNLITGNKKFATNPSNAGKNKMGVACSISLFWLIILFFPRTFGISLESYAFSVILFLALVALNILAYKSFRGYLARINSQS